MIIKSGGAQKKNCPFTQDLCTAHDCMMWIYWIPPDEAYSPMHGSKTHGRKDEEKLGFCGLTSH